jgi:glycopeptide antibiotics resistance protein
MTSWLRHVPLWVWWIPVVWIVSFPLGLTIEPQWGRMHVLPFLDPADKPADLIVNVLLFVPFGYSLWRWSGAFLVVLTGALLTSLSAEMLQVFSTLRYPSGTDVVTGAAGAMVGAFFAARRSGSSGDDVATPGRSRPSN